MSTSADQYYTNLIEGIPTHDVHEWQVQIEHAERHRMDDRSVMDIIGAANVTSAFNADSAPDEPVVGVLAQWLQLAIAIEEQQWVKTCHVT